MSKRFFEGLVSPVTPLTVASFDKPKSGDPQETVKMDIFTANGSAKLPYFPGNDLRGRLRRQAAKAVMDKVKPVPLAIFHALTCGAASSRPGEGSDSVSNILTSRNDLYLGLLGGGPRLHRSGMAVRAMVPVNNATIEIGMVPEKYSHVTSRYISRGADGVAKPAAEVPHCLDIFTNVRRDDVINCQNMHMPELIQDYEANVLAYTEKTNEVQSARKSNKEAVSKAMAEKKATGKTAHDFSDKGPKKNDLANIIGYEAIRPGTPMYLRIDFADHLTDAQVFFAAQSLAGVFNEPMGGWGRAGCGIVRPVSLKYVNNGEETDLFIAHDGEYAANSALPGAEMCDEQLEAFTLKGLQALFTPSDQDATEE